MLWCCMLIEFIPAHYHSNDIYIYIYSCPSVILDCGREQNAAYVHYSCKRAMLSILLFSNLIDALHFGRIRIRLA